MNDVIDYRSLRAGDEEEVVPLWNRCLPRDEISLATFRRKVILDPNLDTRGCQVALSDGNIVGFLLALHRRYPYYDLGLEPGKGWITVFFVDPDHQRRGIGTTLLERGESFLASQHVREISLCDYTPNYFFPGVEVEGASHGHAFLKSRGYHGMLKVYGMGRSLLDLSFPPDLEEIRQRLASSGFSVSLFTPPHALMLLEFLRQYYPGDLFRVALDRLTENPECDEILVALKDGEVVGFSHFQDERFGPFGIHPNYGGRGLGPLLYYLTVEQMRKKGKHNLWLAWTTGHVKDFYHRMGLRVLRRHIIMRKTL